MTRVNWGSSVVQTKVKIKYFLEINVIFAWKYSNYGDSSYVRSIVRMPPALFLMYRLFIYWRNATQRHSTLEEIFTRI